MNKLFAAKVIAANVIIALIISVCYAVILIAVSSI